MPPYGLGNSWGGYILGCSQCLASCLRHSARIGAGSQLTFEMFRFGSFIKMSNLNFNMWTHLGSLVHCPICVLTYKLGYSIIYLIQFLIEIKWKQWYFPSYAESALRLKLWFADCRLCVGVPRKMWRISKNNCTNFHFLIQLVATVWWNFCDDEIFRPNGPKGTISLCCTLRILHKKKHLKEHTIAIWYLLMIVICDQLSQ